MVYSLATREMKSRVVCICAHSLGGGNHKQRVLASAPLGALLVLYTARFIPAVKKLWRAKKITTLAIYILIGLCATLEVMQRAFWRQSELMRETIQLMATQAYTLLEICAAPLQFMSERSRGALGMGAGLAILPLTEVILCSMPRRAKKGCFPWNGILLAHDGKDGDFLNGVTKYWVARGSVLACAHAIAASLRPRKSAPNEHILVIIWGVVVTSSLLLRAGVDEALCPLAAGVGFYFSFLPLTAYATFVHSELKDSREDLQQPLLRELSSRSLRWSEADSEGTPGGTVDMEHLPQPVSGRKE